MNSDMDLVREAFHYRSRFAGSTLVFKIAFPVTSEAAFPSLMNDVSLLAQTGFRVVIVPGAKEWIDSVLAENGVVTEYAPAAGLLAERGAIRITSERAMPFVEMAAFHVATRFMTALSANRCDSVIGNFVRARGLGVLDGRDMEKSGKVEKILVKPIGKTLDSGMVTILPCIGWGPSGKPYNVPSDEVALAAAGALGAVKLFIVSAGKNLSALKVPGDVERAPESASPEGGNSVQSDGASRIVRLTPKEAETILDMNRGAPETAAASPDAARETARGSTSTTDGAAKGIAELRLALAALRAGVERVHIIDGREEGALLRELFSNLGAGTMVSADEYEAIRPLETQDIPGVLRIMEPLTRHGVLVRRSAESILEKKDDYWVFGVDGRVHASGALHRYGGQGEIAAIAVDSAYADMGLGSRVVRFLINRAEKEGLSRVFLLTTQTQDWFETLGFRECGVDSLPKERRKSYDTERNSKIYALSLLSGK